MRLVVALTRTDRHWPDEHYQTLEPAYFIVHGHGVLSWEWIHGFRSWLLPLAHVPLLALASLFGVHSGLALTLFARAVYAIADLVVLARFAQFAIEHQPFDDERHRETARALSLATLLLLPTIALWSASSLQDHLATLVFYGAIPTVFRAISDERPSRWALSGALLSLPVALKLALAPLALGTMATALYARRTHNQSAKQKPIVFAVAIALGALSVALLSALVDLFTIGSFGASAARQLAHGEALSRTYGTSPAWRYLTALPSLIGHEGLALALVLGALSLRRPSAAPRSLTPVSLVAPGALALLVTLSAIAHKEPRFALPIVPALIVSLFNARSCARLAALPSRLAIPALVVGALWSLSSVTTQRIELSDSDVTQLEEHVRRVRAQRPAPDRPVSLCLFGQHWSQMRGSLGVGGPVRYVDAMAFDRPSDALAQCDFAVVRGTHAAQFAAATREDTARRWTLEAPQQNHCALWSAALSPAQSRAPASSHGMLIRGPSRSHT